MYLLPPLLSNATGEPRQKTQQITLTNLPYQILGRAGLDNSREVRLACTIGHGGVSRGFGQSGEVVLAEPSVEGGGHQLVPRGPPVGVVAEEGWLRPASGVGFERRSQVEVDDVILVEELTQRPWSIHVEAVDRGKNGL